MFTPLDGFPPGAAGRYDDMASKTSVRTIIGVPLTPEVLLRIGGIHRLPVTPAGFDPGGAWVNAYRIFTCHGYIEDGNQNVGELRLERVPGAGADGFRLKIRCRIVNSEGAVQFLDAEASCRTDELATLASWRFTSRFEDVHGNPLPDLNTAGSGSVATGVIVTRAGGEPRKRKAPRPVTSDWGLFEAVGRLTHEGPPPPQFDLLEGLSLPRTGHRIFYRGVYRAKGNGLTPMHWFQQIGHGLLPYDYWLDGRRRLQVAVMHSRAWVLDNRAGEAVDARLRQIRRRKDRG